MNIVSRAAPISAICFIWTLFTVFQLYQFSRFIAGVSAMDIFLVIAMATASLIAIGGIWQMKKWGLMLFIGIFTLNQIIVLILGQWHINTLILPLLVIAVGAAHIKQFK